MHMGYKARTCFDKNWLACAVAAPSIKHSVVRNLCEKFSITETIEFEEESKHDIPVVNWNQEKCIFQKECQCKFTKGSQEELSLLFPSSLFWFRFLPFVGREKCSKSL
jgi:hypothetical protein